MNRKGLLSFVLILIGLLLNATTHLAYPLGDPIFRALGIPPWSNGDDSGLHISVIVGLLFIVTGYIGAVRAYQTKFPKIRSRIILSSIAFVLLYPIVTENIMILLNYNSVSAASVDFSKKDSQCSYRPEETEVQASCKLTLFNYGKEKEIAIRPYLRHSSSQIQFEYVTIKLPAHKKVSVGTSFSGKILDGTGITGWSSDIGLEVEVADQRKKYRID